MMNPLAFCTAILFEVVKSFEVRAAGEKRFRFNHENMKTMDNN
jgi:hypothetical protein